MAKIVLPGDDDVDITNFVDNGGGYESNDSNEGNESDDNDKKVGWEQGAQVHH